MKTSWLMVGGFLLVAIVVLFFAYDLGFLFPPQFEGEREVVIPEGTDGREAGSILWRAGIINSASDFALYVMLTGSGGAIRPGHFRFHGGMSTPALLRIITR